MRYPLVPDLAADGVPVAVTCRVLGFSKQAFYAWRKDPVPHRDWDEAHLINAAADIHARPERRSRNRGPVIERFRLTCLFRGRPARSRSRS